MQMIRLEGTLVREPEFRNGVSANGFEWESVDLYLEEDVENGDVYKVSGFGKIVSRVRDYNLQGGAILDCVLKVQSREGSGAHSGKYFLNLGLESFDYKGVNNGVVGVVEDEGNMSPEYMNADPLEGVFGGSNVGDDIFGDGSPSDDLPF